MLCYRQQTMTQQSIQIPKISEGSIFASELYLYASKKGTCILFWHNRLLLVHRRKDSEGTCPVPKESIYVKALTSINQAG